MNVLANKSQSDSVFNLSNFAGGGGGCTFMRPQRKEFVSKYSKYREIKSCDSFYF